MGNTVGTEEAGARQSFVESDESSAAPKFRVYIHRRNRVIHAWLRILPDKIQLEPETKSKQKAEVVSWPLDLIRRYGGVLLREWTEVSNWRRSSLFSDPVRGYCIPFKNHMIKLVQQRVQENANCSHKSERRASKTRCDRAQSSAPDLATEIDRGRINPLQRFGSEGACVSSELKLPRSGSSWSPASLSNRKFRQNNLPPVPRPRSATYGEGGVGTLGPTYAIPKGNGDELGSKIVGNIISESTNPYREDFDLSNAMTLPRHSFPEPIPPSYVNITPTSDGNGVAFKFHRARTNSASSINSVPTTPVATTPNIFPFKWDTGSCSASLLCHLPPLEPDPKLSYVNLAGHPEHTASGINYASVSTLEPMIPTRSYSTGSPPSYSLIDAERTRALQHAAMERQSASRRRHQTSD